MVETFRKIIKHEGFATLYRGITAPIFVSVFQRPAAPQIARSQLLRLSCRIGG